MIWDDNRGVIRALCEEWNQAHPDQTVQLIVSPWDGYWDKLFAMMVAHDAPDVFWLTPVYRVTYISRGQLLDLSPYVERDSFSLDDFQPRELVMDWVVDGKVYGINRDFDTIGLFYNRRLFEEAGIPYPDDTWDWNRLLEVALEFKDYFARTGQDDKWPLDIPTWDQGGWQNLVWQNGGRTLSEDGTRFMLDQPEAVEALQWQADLIFKHRVCPISGAGAVGGIELFTAGKLAMTYHGSWTVRQVAATKDLDWDVAVLPKGRQRAVVTNGLAECVWRGTEHPELCWEFVKYLTSDACQRRLPVIASRRTATREWLQSNIYARETDGEMRRVMIPESGHVFIDMLDYARARPITPDLLEWTDALSKYTQALLQAGEMDAKEAMRRAAEEVNPILQRSR
jgi:multiple sugar transport system substrate-binding protein